MSFSPEDSLLKVLLIDTAAYWRVADIVVPADFGTRGRRLFEAVANGAKAGESVDFIAIGERMGREMGDEAMDIACNVPGSAENVESYARLLAKAGEKRRVQEAGKRITVASTYDEGQQLLADARPLQASSVKSVTDGVTEMLNTMQARASGPTGLSWGIPAADSTFGLLAPSRLYGIAARAKMGKTTLSLRPQLHALLAGKRVLNFSLEMTAGELVQRALASVGQFSHDIFESEEGVPDEKWPTINEAVRQIIATNWLIDDEPGLSMDQITGRAIQHHAANPLDLIVLDHMGLVRLAKRNSRNDELGEVSYGLKNLAKKLRLPIVSLLQLNRSLESRDNKRPTMPDLRDSGNIEQDFDCIVGIYRDDVYNEHSLDAGHAELIGIANRHRKAGTAFVRADMDTMTYGPAKEPRRCFPSVGTSRGGSGGSGFASFGSKGSQSRPLAVVGRDG